MNNALSLNFRKEQYIQHEITFDSSKKKLKVLARTKLHHRM